MRQIRIEKSITNREHKSIEIYLQEIRKIPLLETKEEAKLAKQARE